MKEQTLILYCDICISYSEKGKIMDSSMSGQQTQADTRYQSDKFIRVDSDSGEGELCNLIAMKQACHVWGEN